MLTRRSDALVVTAALTYAVAVVAHALVHVLDGEAVLWLSWAHGAMAVTALGALAYAAVRLGWGGDRVESRRRASLMRAALGGATPGPLAAFALQAILIASLLVAEGGLPSPEQMAGTLIATAIAAFVAAFALRGSRRAVVAALGNWLRRVATRPTNEGWRAVRFVVTALAGGAFVAAARPVRAPPAR